MKTECTSNFEPQLLQDITKTLFGVSDTKRVLLLPSKLCRCCKIAHKAVLIILHSANSTSEIYFKKYRYVMKDLRMKYPTVDFDETLMSPAEEVEMLPYWKERYPREYNHVDTQAEDYEKMWMELKADAK